MRLLQLAGGPEQLALARRAVARGHELVLLDRTKACPCAALAAEVHEVDLLDEAACLAIARAAQPQGVITTAIGAAVRTAAGLAGSLGLPGPPVDAVDRLTNKARMRLRLAERGLPSARCRLFRDPAEAVDHLQTAALPLIVKPVDGSGSRGVARVDDPAAAAAAVERAFAASRLPASQNRVIVEQFLEGEHFGSEGFVAGGRVRFLTLRRATVTLTSERCQETGYRFPCGLPAATALRVETRLAEVLLALGLDKSPFHADFVLHQGEPVVVDVGARLPGYSLAEHFTPHATGVDPFDGLIDLATGLTPEVFSVAPRVRPTAMRFFQLDAAADPARVDAALADPAVVALRLSTEDLGGLPLGPTPAAGGQRGFVVTTGRTGDEAASAAETVIGSFLKEHGNDVPPRIDPVRDGADHRRGAARLAG